jgi:hypothetical protein
MNHAETLLGFSTPELARHLGITAEGMRVHLCKRGSYYGLRPERLPNGRLIWPADSVQRLKEAGRKTRVHTPERKGAAAKAAGHKVAGVEQQRARG